MKIAILGYGIQGRSALDYWQSGDNEITICDQKSDLALPSGVKSQLGTNYLAKLSDFDLIVRSPNIHPRDIVAANQPDILSKVTTPTNEFMRVCPTKNIIGVTGTKGKGTTCSLIAEILKATGKKVYLGGNFGISPLDLLKSGIRSADWVVLELANFQLIDLKQSPHLAVCLMVSAEHLDWHQDMAEYMGSKKQLFMHQSSHDVAVYYAKNEKSVEIAHSGPARKVPFYEKPGAVVENGNFVIDGESICATKDLKLLGEHNWQNVCAAITLAWQVTKDAKIIGKAVTSFKGLANRLELVRELAGVKYYNDSFGSAPDATIAAIKAIGGPKVVIVGGFDRKLPLGSLVETIKNHSSELRSIILIGASNERVSIELESAGFFNFVTLNSKAIGEIVKEAHGLAQSGDSVILSPGFPSFDMFKNFDERGQQFKDAVNQL